MEPVADVSYLDLAIAGLLVAASMLLSWRLQLGLHRTIFWGALRTFAQLAITGYVLGFIFSMNAWYLTLEALAVMLWVAVHTAQGRVSAPLVGKTWVFAVAIVSGSLLVLFYITALVLKIEPWYDPRYLLPLAGMILGNAMTAATLAVDRYAGDLRRRRDEVETALALGANATQAAEPIRRDALRAALMPSVNAMLVVGIVSLPGMMTGQIIAGQDPSQAVRYQVMVMYMITAASFFASIIGILVATRQTFTPAHQLLAVETLENH